MLMTLKRLLIISYKLNTDKGRIEHTNSSDSGYKPVYCEVNYFRWYKFSWVENKYYFHGFDVVCMPAFRTIIFDSHIPTKIGIPQVIMNTIHIPVICVNGSDFNCSLKISLCIFSNYYRMELLDKL